MKLVLVSMLSISLFSTNALADHHGHSAGDLSFVSNGEFKLDSVATGDMKYTTAESKGVVTIDRSSYAALPSNTVLVYSCTGSSLEKDGKQSLYALCSAKDKDGNEFSIENSRDGALGTAGPGNSVLRGVSGKFKDMMGTCSYIPTYMMNDGVYISVAYDCKMKH